jgi:hypothetical protein
MAVVQDLFPIKDRRNAGHNIVYVHPIGHHEDFHVPLDIPESPVHGNGEAQKADEAVQSDKKEKSQYRPPQNGQNYHGLRFLQRTGEF